MLSLCPSYLKLLNNAFWDWCSPSSLWIRSSRPWKPPSSVTLRYGNFHNFLLPCIQTSRKSGSPGDRAMRRSVLSQVNAISALLVTSCTFYTASWENVKTRVSDPLFEGISILGTSRAAWVVPQRSSVFTNDRLNFMYYSDLHINSLSWCLAHHFTLQGFNSFEKWSVGKISNTEQKSFIRPVQKQEISFYSAFQTCSGKEKNEDHSTSF